MIKRESKKMKFKIKPHPLCLKYLLYFPMKNKKPFNWNKIWLFPKI